MCGQLRHVIEAASGCVADAAIENGAEASTGPGRLPRLPQPCVERCHEQLEVIVQRGSERAEGEEVGQLELVGTAAAPASAHEHAVPAGGGGW